MTNGTANDIMKIVIYVLLLDLMVIQQQMSFVNEEYTSLGDILKSRAAELNSLVQEVKEAQKETADMMTWLKDMKKTAASWDGEATEVKTQLEMQKVKKKYYILNESHDPSKDWHIVLICLFCFLRYLKIT